MRTLGLVPIQIIMRLRHLSLNSRSGLRVQFDFRKLTTLMHPGIRAGLSLQAEALQPKPYQVQKGLQWDDRPTCVMRT